MTDVPRWLRRGLAVLLIGTASGCATAPLHTARGFYYTGAPERGAAVLADAEVPERDEVLVLMERGTMWQAAGDFDKSSADFIKASDTIERFETKSTSRGAASMVINDSVNRYSGRPFEQVLLHNLTAINHLSSGHRDEAGVEARRTLKILHRTSKDAPNLAFGWYMAGLGLELADDKANAVNAYAEARKINTTIPEPISLGQEIVYIALIGRGPSMGYGNYRSESPHPDIQLVLGDQPVGKAHILGDTHQLMADAAKAEATKKALKTLGRIATKEVIAQSLANHYNEDVVGDLARIILIGILERPDDRNWNTLPHWLMVTRAPLHGDPEDIALRINGRRRITPDTPPVRYGNTWFCFSRILN